MTDLKNFTDAAKLDILAHLEKDKPGVFEFRRIETITKLMIPLVNSLGHPAEHGALGVAMRAAEDVAPMLYDALAGRSFDGNSLLRDKYEQMKVQHRDLQLKALDIQDAAAEVEKERSELGRHKQSLDAHKAALERERERLAITANSQGDRLNLPPMPRLGSGGDMEGMIVHTGIYVEEKVSARLNALHTNARTTPAIVLSQRSAGPEGKTEAELAWGHFYKAMEEEARIAGLPDLGKDTAGNPIRYGMNFGTHEILGWREDTGDTVEAEYDDDDDPNNDRFKGVLHKY